jgi:hypothetical protein
VPLAFKLTDDVEYPQAFYDIHTRVPPLSARELWRDRSKGLMHLQHVSRRRLMAKQTLYKMNEVLRFGTAPDAIERKYNPTLDETGMKLAPVPAEWGVPDVQPDAEPWQEAEVRRLLGVHGWGRFAGLTCAL